MYAHSSRLPDVPRERRPGFALLGVLLVLAGAVATVVSAMRAGERTEVITISQRLGAGQPIPLAAMSKREVAPVGTYLPWSERERLAGTVTTVTIPPGTLLTRAMTTPAATEHVPGKARVGLLLGPGQIPDGLAAGDRVQIVHVPRTATAGQSRVLVPNARVDGVAKPNGPDSGRVDVMVDGTLSPQIAEYASKGEIAVSELGT
ncbi:hypothetical protein [Nonomuraea zeae]|uniref:SAF domain-containing protein n=1 Tax=Nonomuraea zeae TaxID=1642303 RepID=A0A5S4H8E3_9ACTN|nr:hypothetical protein [Nonomuraea zeae]TMR35090.1 hypothetical protein ETD85_14755 [Nonomuraea zeae]